MRQYNSRNRHKSLQLAPARIYILNNTRTYIYIYKYIHTYRSCVKKSISANSASDEGLLNGRANEIFRRFTIGTALIKNK